MTNFHADLEGIKNCTKCHEIGSKIRNKECLECHTEIQKTINENRGYHSSKDVKDKHCYTCHSEHHGRNFRIINFNSQKFDHSKTSFRLIGKHAKIECNKCHNKDLIVDEKIKKIKDSYLGLPAKCADCHEDVHLGTLGNKCENCHNTDSFKPAALFNHNKAKFILTGAHQEVDCIKCHIIEDRNGKKFQKFTGLEFSTCLSCHNDFHEGKLGKNCNSCHTTESFHKIIHLQSFDHDRTGYPLAGKHLDVKCNACHRNGNYKVKLKYDKCYRCHTDYHEGEFTKNGIQTDCEQCHSISGFQQTTFTIERHNNTEFKLAGGHLAIPCQNCHEFKNPKVKRQWKFNIIGKECVNCHNNAHGESIIEKIHADKNCELCHTVNSWTSLKEFNHELTGYKLEGQHAKAACNDCHKPNNIESAVKISFKTNTFCTTCHKDIHFGQFSINALVNCDRCHIFTSWKPEKFNHDSTRFSLKGAHIKVPCESCHKKVTDSKGTYIRYHYKAEIKCATCHI